VLFVCWSCASLLFCVVLKKVYRSRCGGALATVRGGNKYRGEGGEGTGRGRYYVHGHTATLLERSIHPGPKKYVYMNVVAVVGEGGRGIVSNSSPDMVMVVMIRIQNRSYVINLCHIF